MVAWQSGCCKTEFGAEREREISCIPTEEDPHYSQLSYLHPSLPLLLQPWGFPHELSRRKSSGLSVVATALFPSWGRDGNELFLAWLFDFSLGQAQQEATSHPVYRCWRREALRKNPRKREVQKAEPAANIARGWKPQGWRWGHPGRDIGKQRERGKGRCKGVAQSLGRGRKVGGGSGLCGELSTTRAEQLTPSFSWGRSLHTHIHGLLGRRLGGTICCENVTHLMQEGKEGA